MGVSWFEQNRKLIFDVVRALCKHADFDYFIVIVDKNAKKKSTAASGGYSEENKQLLFDCIKEYIKHREKE